MQQGKRGIGGWMRLTLPTYTPIFFFVIPFIRNVLCLLKCLFKHCPQYVSVKPGWPELLPSPQHMQAQAAAKAPMSTAAVDAMRLLLGSSVDKPSHFGQKGNCVTKQLGPASVVTLMTFEFGMQQGTVKGQDTELEPRHLSICQIPCH